MFLALVILTCLSSVGFVRSQSTCTLKTHVPTGKKCKKPGQVKTQYRDRNYGGLTYIQKTYSIYDPQRTDTVEECARLCSGRIYDTNHSQVSDLPEEYDDPHGWCQSFFYSESSKFCQLGRFTVTKAVDPAPKSSSDFYDIQCFDCGNPFSQPYGTQLLENGGFENELFGSWFSSFATFSKPGRNSNTSYTCNTSIGKENYERCWLLQNFNQLDEEIYGVSFDYKTQAFPGNRTNFLIAMGFPAEQSEISIYYPFRYTIFEITSAKGESTDWKRLTVYHRADKNHWGPNFLLVDYEETQAVVYIDNIEVNRIKGDIATVLGSQLFSNGGFEGATIAPWIQRSGDNRFVVVSPGINSKKALRYTHGKGKIAYGTPFLLQKLQMDANSTYLFSFTYRFKSKGRFRSGFVIFQPLDKGSEIRFTIPLKNGLDTYSIPVTGLGGTVQFYISFDFEDSVIGMELVVDNFSLTRFPGRLM